MESIMVKNQSVSGYNNKQNRAPKKKNNNNSNNNNNTRSFSPKISENLAPMSFHGSLFQLPHRSLSFSYPSVSPLLSQPYQYQQNPPLLPLPVAPISRNLSVSLPSTPPAKQSLHRATRDQSLNIPRKRRSKPNNNSPKPTKPEDESLLVVAKARPEPLKVKLPRDVPKVSSSVVVVADNLEKFSGGSALSLLSPPPSSLPLPRFSLKPAATAKLSCTAEAAGIDAGATDNLRLILRL